MAKGNKTGGRVKGTPNRLTKEMRLILKNVVGNELEHLNRHMEQLEPIDRLNLLLKLLPYVMPKVKDIWHDRDEPIDLNFDF